MSSSLKAKWYETENDLHPPNPLPPKAEGGIPLSSGEGDYRGRGHSLFQIGEDRMLYGATFSQS